MACGVNGHFGRECMLSTKDLRNKPELDLAATLTQVVEGGTAMAGAKSPELFLMAQRLGLVRAASWELNLVYDFHLVVTKPTIITVDCHLPYDLDVTEMNILQL